MINVENFSEFEEGRYYVISADSDGWEIIAKCTSMCNDIAYFKDIEIISGRTGPDEHWWVDCDDWMCYNYNKICKETNPEYFL